MKRVWIECPACKGRGDEGNNYLNSGQCSECRGMGLVDFDEWDEGRSDDY